MVGDGNDFHVFRPGLLEDFLHIQLRIITVIGPDVQIDGRHGLRFLPDGLPDLDCFLHRFFHRTGSSLLCLSCALEQIRVIRHADCDKAQQQIHQILLVRCGQTDAHVDHKPQKHPPDFEDDPEYHQRHANSQRLPQDHLDGGSRALVAADQFQPCIGIADGLTVQPGCHESQTDHGGQEQQAIHEVKQEIEYMRRKNAAKNQQKLNDPYIYRKQADIEIDEERIKVALIVWTCPLQDTGVLPASVSVQLGLFQDQRVGLAKGVHSLTILSSVHYIRFSRCKKRKRSAPSL